MAFTNSTFFPIGQGNGNCIYFYKSADAPATVAGSGYFNDVAHVMNNGDIILLAGTIGGTQTVDVLVITSATGAATVTSTNGT